MKPFDSTVSIRIADLLTYRPPDSIDTLQRPLVGTMPLTWQEVARITSDRLRSSWAALCAFGAYLWGRDMTAQELAERTITIEIAAVSATPEARRRTNVAVAGMAVVALLVALSLGMTTGPAPAQASAVITHVTPRVTWSQCVTAHGATMCKIIGNNWGYCSKIHYPQQDKHCKTLLPPKEKGK